MKLSRYIPAFVEFHEELAVFEHSVVDLGDFFFLDPDTQLCYQSF